MTDQNTRSNADESLDDSKSSREHPRSAPRKRAPLEIGLDEDVSGRTNQAKPTYLDLNQIRLSPTDSRRRPSSLERLIHRQGHDRARDDPYEQVNRAMMDSQMELYQFMENVSHLAKQSEARAQDAPMIGPEPNSIASFHKLALDLIDETVSVLHFRIGHSKDWSELRNRIPAHLREPLSKARRLAGDLSIAERELKCAIEDDVWYGVRAVPMQEARLSGEDARKELRTRFLEEMKQELVQLRERVAEANEAERSTAKARGEAEVELATEWREEHHARLASLLADYEPHYNLHRLQISGLVDMQKHTLGELAEGTSSGCQVLLTFAQRVHGGRIDRFHGLDATHLKAVVEKEIGWLARAVPSTAARPPQDAQATTWNDTDDTRHPGCMTPSWHELSEKQQAVVAWLMTRERGESHTSSQVLQNAPGVNDKGADRPVLTELEDLGLIIKTDAKRPQLRLTKIPQGTPGNMPRAATWTDNSGPK